MTDYRYNLLKSILCDAEIRKVPQFGHIDIFYLNTTFANKGEMSIKAQYQVNVLTCLLDSEI